MSAYCIYVHLREAGWPHATSRWRLRSTAAGSAQLRSAYLDSRGADNSVGDHPTAAERRPDHRQAPVQRQSRELLRRRRCRRQGADLGGDGCELLPRARNLAAAGGGRGHPARAGEIDRHRGSVRRAVHADLRVRRAPAAGRGVRQEQGDRVGLPASARGRLHGAGRHLLGGPVHARAQAGLVPAGDRAGRGDRARAAVAGAQASGVVRDRGAVGAGARRGGCVRVCAVASAGAEPGSLRKAPAARCRPAVAPAPRAAAREARARARQARAGARPQAAAPRARSRQAAVPRGDGSSSDGSAWSGGPMLRISGIRRKSARSISSVEGV